MALKPNVWEHNTNRRCAQPHDLAIEHTVQLHDQGMLYINRTEPTS